MNIDEDKRIEEAIKELDELRDKLKGHITDNSKPSRNNFLLDAFNIVIIGLTLIIFCGFLLIAAYNMFPICEDTTLLTQGCIENKLDYWQIVFIPFGSGLVIFVIIFIILVKLNIDIEEGDE